MKPPVPFHLPLESLKRIEEICERFERGTSAEDRDIPALLRSVNESERPVLLRELIALDLELRRERGEDPQRDDYVDLAETHCPDLQIIDPGFLSGRLLELDGIGGATAQVPTSHRYRFDEPIGRGGIGEVWRVFDNQTQRPLAIKLLRQNYRDNQQASQRFRREALVTGILQHPGVPPIYDQGQLDDGSDYFSMKLVEGKTFAEILDARDVDDIDDDSSNSETEDTELLGKKLEVYLRIAQTLAYAHTRGVIHRDLKPQNIMVGRFGEVQVMDWGLAKSLFSHPESDATSAESILTDRHNTLSGDAPGSPQDALGSPQDAPGSPQDSSIDTGHRDTPLNDALTRVGDVVGTPNYMSPEQARGDVEQIDARTDVFGLGTILYQILTGKGLYGGTTPHEVIQQSAQGDMQHAYASLGRVEGHEPLVDLCQRCLHPDATRRPKNGGEVAESVQQHMQGLERKLRRAELEKTQAETRSAEQIKRQRWIAGLSAVIAAVSIFGAIAVGIQWNRARLAADAEHQALIKAREESATVSDVNGYLLSVLESPLPENLGGDVRLRDVIDETLPDLDGKFAAKPAVEGQIRRTLGETYRWLGDLDAAEEQHRSALEAFEKALSPDSPDRLMAMDRLAGVLRSRGEPEDIAEASRLRSEVLERCRSQFGPSHPETVLAMNNLGTVLIEERQYEEASQLYLDVIDRIESIPEAGDAVDRLTVMLNLADTQDALGDEDAAEENYRQVIHDCEDATDPRRTNAMVSLGEMLAEQSRHDEAVSMLEQAFQGREQYFGDRHPYTLSAMRKLTRTMVAAGQADQSLSLLRDCLARHNESIGPARGLTFSVRRELADALLQSGQKDAAIQFLEATHAILAEHRGPDHDYTLEALDQLESARNSL